MFKLSKYKEVNTLALLEDLVNKGAGINNKQRTIIERELAGYIIIERSISSHPTFLARISSPLFFVVFGLLVFVVSPIKWLVTGEYYWQADSKFALIMMRWHESFLK